MPRKSPFHVLRDCILVEVFERKFVAQAVGMKLAFDSFNGMITQDHIHWPICPDDHEASRVLSSCKIGDQIEGRDAPAQAAR